MKWGISIRSPKASKQIIKDSFKVAKALALKAKEKYSDRPDVQVDLISRTKAFAPPRDFIPRGKRYWCPYCTKERMFKKSIRKDAKVCPVCGISDRDWYVKTYNHLWPSVAEMERKARERKGRVRKGVLR
jgi:hypothetical protein